MWLVAMNTANTQYFRASAQKGAKIKHKKTIEN